MAGHGVYSRASSAEVIGKPRTRLGAPPNFAPAVRLRSWMQMENTHAHQRLLSARQGLLEFEQHACAAAIAAAAEPILAEFRQCIGSLEQQATASGPWAASHPDLRTPFESVTAGLAERLETSTVPCIVVDLAG